MRTGKESMVGAEVEVLDGFREDGRVRAFGEIWQARTSTPLKRGSTVRITAIDGLTLTVEPAHKED